MAVEFELAVVDEWSVDVIFEEGKEDVIDVDFIAVIVGTDVVVEPRLSGGLLFDVEVEIGTEGREDRDVKGGRDVDVMSGAPAGGTMDF